MERDNTSSIPVAGVKTASRLARRSTMGGASIPDVPTTVVQEGRGRRVFGEVLVYVGVSIVVAAVLDSS